VDDCHYGNITKLKNKIIKNNKNKITSYTTICSIPSHKIKAAIKSKIVHKQNVTRCIVME
jgi:hypothetical protein